MRLLGMTEIAASTEVQVHWCSLEVRIARMAAWVAALAEIFSSALQCMGSESAYASLGAVRGVFTQTAASSCMPVSPK